MQTESGLEFLSRVNTSPVSELGKDFFAAPLSPPEIIEVSGPPGVGKSLLCLDLMASALLPKTLFGITIDGLETDAVFIDCDQHFNILHFTDILERKIKKICYEVRCKLKKLGDEKKQEELMNISKKDYNKKIQNTIAECLKRLTYLNCTNSTQFAVTLLSLEQCVTSKTNISLIIIDSISAFYWYDRVYKVDSWQKMEGHLNQLFQKLVDIIKKHYIVCISTKQDLFKKRKDEWQDSSNMLNENLKTDELVTYEYLGKEWMNGVSVRIHVSYCTKNEKELSETNLDTNGHRIVETSCESATRVSKCSFHEDGVRWMRVAVEEKST